MPNWYAGCSRFPFGICRFPNVPDLGGTRTAQDSHPGPPASSQAVQILFTQPSSRALTSLMLSAISRRQRARAAHNWMSRDREFPKGTGIVHGGSIFPNWTQTVHASGSPRALRVRPRHSELPGYDARLSLTSEGLCGHEIADEAKLTATSQRTEQLHGSDCCLSTCRPK